MNSIVTAVGNLFGAIGGFFGWKREQATRVNTPEMQANAKGEQDADAANAARKKVEKGDATEIREGLS